MVCPETRPYLAETRGVGWSLRSLGEDVRLWIDLFFGVGWPPPLALILSFLILILSRDGSEAKAVTGWTVMGGPHLQPCLWARWTLRGAQPRSQEMGRSHCSFEIKSLVLSWSCDHTPVPFPER